MFKNWKEADKRATELLKELDTINAEVASLETEARSEDIDVEKRGEIINSIQSKITARNDLQVKHDEAKDAAVELKSAEEKQFGLIDNLTTQKVFERKERNSDKSVYETRDYELAWAKYIRTGNDYEVRSLISTQNTGVGNVLIPKTLSNKIEDTLMSGGRLINLCDIVNIAGITEYPIVLDKSDPDLHNETGDSKIEKEITFTSVSMEPQFIAEMLRTTRKFEADSISAFWNWIMSELPDALRRVIDRKILIGGQGSNDGIHGILTNTDNKFVATLANHTLNFNSANQAVALLDDGVEDNVTVVTHRQTFYNNVMGLRGADGHPIWQQIQTSNLNKPAFYMGGYPVVFTKELPSYDEASVGQAYMVVGNFKAMKLNFPMGMNTRITRDELTEMHNNIIRYRNEIYVAGNIVRLGSFVKVVK